MDNSAGSKRLFTPEFKLKVVLESMQRDTTVEQVKRKYNISYVTLPI